MSFGRTIQGERVSYWGARVIYEGYKQNYYIDLLPDRQGGENVGDAFLYWLNHRAMPWLRQRVKELGLNVDDDQVLVLDEFKYRLEASTNRSYGYLYCGAIEKSVAEISTHRNAVMNVTERVFKCGDKTYVWGPFAPIPEPGQRGKVTTNKLGFGTVVGYQSEKYADSGHELLNLLVALEKPPTQWKKQTFQRELERAMKEHIVAQKHKKVRTNSTFHTTWDYVPTGEPDKDSLKKFKESYKDPPMVCWGELFQPDAVTVEV